MGETFDFDFFASTSPPYLCFSPLEPWEGAAIRPFFDRFISSLPTARVETYLFDTFNSKIIGRIGRTGKRLQRHPQLFISARLKSIIFLIERARHVGDLEEDILL